MSLVKTVEQIEAEIVACRKKLLDMPRSSTVRTIVQRKRDLVHRIQTLYWALGREEEAKETPVEFSGCRTKEEYEKKCSSRY